MNKVELRKVSQPVRVNPFLKAPPKRNPELVADLLSIAPTTVAETTNSSTTTTNQEDYEITLLPDDPPTPQMDDDEQHSSINMEEMSDDLAASKVQLSVHEQQLPATKKVDAFASMMRNRSSTSSSKNNPTAKKSAVDSNTQRPLQPV
ncbi:hypothetical protein TKK_0007166 [Trichogramma kaykai]